MTHEPTSGLEWNVSQFADVKLVLLQVYHYICMKCSIIYHVSIAKLFTYNHHSLNEDESRNNMT